MKAIITITIIATFIFTFIKPAQSQLRVENDGSVYVNSYTGSWGRAMWTKIHTSNACAYHLWNTNYEDQNGENGDVFCVLGNGAVWTINGYLQVSDSAFKTNIQPIVSSLDKINNLRGVTYNRKYYSKKTITDSSIVYGSGHSETVFEQRLEPKEYGLIAQEVEKVIPEAVYTMDDSTKAIYYSSIIPVLIEAIKEQQIQIENLQKIVCDHGEKIVSLRECCDSKDTTLKSESITTGYDEDETSISTAKLYQNVPNPFSVNTEIKCEIPESFEIAKIYIFNLQGNEIKSYNILNTGINTIIINGHDFEPGMYIYSLVVDNKIIDTKKMLLTKD